MPIYDDLCFYSYYVLSLKKMNIYLI